MSITVCICEYTCTPCLTSETDVWLQPTMQLYTTHGTLKASTIYIPQYSTVVTNLSKINCYQFTDPEGMDGLVDHACPRIQTQACQTCGARNQAAHVHIHSATQTDKKVCMIYQLYHIKMF